MLIRPVRMLAAGIAAVLCSALAVPAQAQATLTYSNNGTTLLNYADPLCPAFNAQTVGSNLTITCGTAPPGAPTGCVASISTVPSPLTSAGGTATPSISCNAPPAGSTITYSWKRNSTAGYSTNNPLTDPLPANTGTSNVTYTYTGTACIGAACTTVAPSVSATVPGTGGGGGGGGGGASCSAWANTTGGAILNYTIPWAINGTFANQIAFGPNDIIVMKLVVPIDAATTLKGGHVDLANYGGNDANRYMVLSLNPCDFTPFSTKGSESFGQSAHIYFGTATSTTLPKLVPGNTYYFNMVNRYGTNPITLLPDLTTETCFDATCPVRGGYVKPL